MPIIFGVIASEESGHLQPQPPIIDTISGAVVISGGTTSGSNSIVQVAFTSNPYGQRATSYAITAFSGSPLVAITGTTVTGANSPLNITYPFVANAYYQFKGTATNAKGTSSYGIASNQVEPFVATVTPSGLSVNIISTSGTRFTFLQVPGATSYLLSANGSYTDPTTNITTTDSASVIISGTAIGYSTVSGILNHGYFVGMPYNFFVQSQNFAGTSASGANISLTPNPFGPPLAPVFTATKSGTSNPVINVVITPDTNTLDNLPTGYFIGDSTGGFSSITQLGVTTTLSNTTTPIQPVSTINVLAKNNYTGASGTAGTPVVLNFLPATPASVSASVTTPASGFDAASASGTVAVSWSQTSNAQYSAPTGYTITATAAGYTTISTTSTTTSVNLSGLFNVNIPYTVSVTANNAAGTSSAGTASSTVTPYQVVVPGTVTSVTASATSTTTVDLSWSAPSSGGPYSNFSITSSPSIALTPSSTATGTVSTTVNGTFAKGQSYTFSVNTSNAAGAGTAGSSNSVLPNPKPTVNATNATHYSDSTYDYAVWRTTGTLSITTVNLANVEILAVGAGGGGGAYRTVTGGYAGGGGGGAGQILAQSYGTLGTTAINVNIGAGGAGGSGGNGGVGGGSNLIYNSPPYTNLFAVYGGGGGGYNGAGIAGANGGGGSANNGAGGTGNTASQGQSSGYNGGAGYIQTAGSADFAGGGGGAFQDGQGGVTNSRGGSGLQFSDWASATSTGAAGYYAGGGGGGESNNNSGSWGTGGAGGGGTGASLAANATQATAGTANTGGGGGGAAGPSYSTAGAGGSGLIILRWPLGTANIGF